MINIRAYNGKETFRLEEIAEDIRIGILTGTFDPAHKAHINVANQTLKELFGDEGNDYVFLYPHSFTPSKNPISQLIRMNIIQRLIYNDPNLAILDVNDGHHISPLPPTALIDYLMENTLPKYSRIIGADKLSYARKNYCHVPHFVNNRFNESLELPENFYQVQSSEDVSSTQMREGKVPFGEEYLDLRKNITRYYPSGRIK